MNDIDAIEENDSSVFELKIDDEISFRPRNSLGVRRKSLAPIDINTSDINLSNQSTPIKSPLVKGSSSKIPIQHNSPIRYGIGGSSINDENIANDGRISPLLMPLNNTDDTQLENNSPLLISINDRPIVLSEELITEEYEIRNGSPLLLSIDDASSLIVVI